MHGGGPHSSAKRAIRQHTITQPRPGRRRGLGGCACTFRALDRSGTRILSFSNLGDLCAGNHRPWKAEPASELIRNGGARGATPFRIGSCLGPFRSPTSTTLGPKSAGPQIKSLPFPDLADACILSPSDATLARAGLPQLGGLRRRAGTDAMRRQSLSAERKSASYR